MAARKNYQTAVDMGIDDESVYANLGYIYLDNYYYETAADYFIKAADKGNNPVQMYNAGLAFFNAGQGDDYDNALLWFGKALDNGFTNRNDALKYIQHMVDKGYVSKEEASPWLD